MGAMRHLPVQTCWKGALECMGVGGGWGGITSFSQAFLFLDPPVHSPTASRYPLHYITAPSHKQKMIGGVVLIDRTKGSARRRSRARVGRLHI